MTQFEPTDEMIQAFESAAGRAVGRDSLAGIAAVLAIVARNQAGPCPASFHIGVLAATQPLRCDLRAGHAGDHESGGTRWWEHSADPAARLAAESTEEA